LILTACTDFSICLIRKKNITVTTSHLKPQTLILKPSSTHAATTPSCVRAGQFSAAYLEHGSPEEPDPRLLRLGSGVLVCVGAVVPDVKAKRDVEQALKHTRSHVTGGDLAMPHGNHRRHAAFGGAAYSIVKEKTKFIFLSYFLGQKCQLCILRHHVGVCFPRQSGIGL